VTRLPVIPLPPSSHAKPVDSFQHSEDLAHALRAAVRGEVRFDRGSRALYASDSTPSVLLPT